MTYRLFCVFAVTFCIAMTGYLLRRTYYSEEDDLPYVTVDEVITRFAKNSSQSNLNVFRDRDRVGSISVTPDAHPDGSISLRISALGEVDYTGLKKQDIAWGGEIKLTPELDVTHFELKVKFSQPRIDVDLEIDPATFQIHFRVSNEGETLLDSSDEKSASTKAIKLLLATRGLSPKALKRKSEAGESLAGDKVKMVAQRGDITIGGQDFDAYILTVTGSDSGKFKLYFDATGALIKVSPTLGYLILADIFEDEMVDKERAKME